MWLMQLSSYSSVSKVGRNERKIRRGGRRENILNIKIFHNLRFLALKQIPYLLLLMEEVRVVSVDQLDLVGQRFWSELLLLLLLLLYEQSVLLLLHLLQGSGVLSRPRVDLLQMHPHLLLPPLFLLLLLLYDHPLPPPKHRPTRHRLELVKVETGHPLRGLVQGNLSHVRRVMRHCPPCRGWDGGGRSDHGHRGGLVLVLLPAVDVHTERCNSFWSAWATLDGATKNQRI